jgi:hypothetical protein
MYNFPKQKCIIKATLDGIKTAEKNFSFWTNERLFLSYGTPGMITLHVASQIAKIQDAPEIFIDATVADILRCSLPSRKEFPTYMKNNKISQGTFSITLDQRFEHKNDNDSISKVLISLANGVRNVKVEYTNEIERLCKMINPDACANNSLEYGIFAFYSDLSESARKKLEKRIPQIIHSFDEVVKKFPSLESRYYGSGITKVPDKGEWCAGCYLVQPKRV